MKPLKFSQALLWILFLALTDLSVASAAKAQFKEKIATPKMFQQLQQGGFVLYMRHGTTDNSRGDRMPSVDVNDCNTQRVLNQAGHQTTLKVGEYFKQANIPVEEIFASPMCRAKDSAQNTFGRLTIEPALMYTGGMTTAQKKPVLAKTRALLSQPVANNANRILVAHAPNLMDLIGYYPPESTLVIFSPKGEGVFEYIGSIRPGDWPTLLNALTALPADE